MTNQSPNYSDARNFIIETRELNPESVTPKLDIYAAIGDAQHSLSYSKSRFNGQIKMDWMTELPEDHKHNGDGWRRYTFQDGSSLIIDYGAWEFGPDSEFKKK